MVVAILFLTAGATRAQTDSVKKKRLKSPATVKGFVGGEAHDGKTQTRKIPATGNYYIYVTAHPTAKYTLKVTVK